MKLLLTALTLSLLTVPAFARDPMRSAYRDSMGDYMLKRYLISESIKSYSGQCACPYSLDSNGVECGDRSAWSKPGGADPLCYYDEISPWMLENYRLGLLR